MEIVLNGPVALVLKPETMATILDVLANHLSYAKARPILDGEIFPQLEGKADDKLDTRAMDPVSHISGRPYHSGGDHQE